MNDSTLRRDMLWNSVGNFVYLLSQWLVTVLVARLFDLRGAGILSVAMSLSAVFQSVARFGIRNYQVSDVSRKYTDGAYLVLRHLTVLLSFVMTVVAALAMGYSSEIFFASVLYMLFRIVESYSDVLHGASQRAGRLDVAGRGFALKAGALLIGFLIGFFFTRSLVASLGFMLLGALAVTLFYDLPVAKGLSSGLLHGALGDAWSLAKETLPLAIYFFMFSTIASIPKFVLEKTVGTALLGAYSSIFSPALLLTHLAGYVYTPFIPLLAKRATNGDEKGFRRITCRVFLAILALLLFFLLAERLFGEWVLVLVFGEMIRPHVGLFFPILIAIFALAVLAFFCTLTVIRRRFLPLCIAVFVGAALSLILSFVFVRGLNVNGASYALFIAATVATLILILPALRRGVRGASPDADAQKGDFYA